MPQRRHIEDTSQVMAGEAGIEVGSVAPDTGWNYDDAHTDGPGGIIIVDEAANVTIVTAEKYTEPDTSFIGYRGFLDTTQSPMPVLTVTTYLNLVR